MITLSVASQIKVLNPASHNFWLLSSIFFQKVKFSIHYLLLSSSPNLELYLVIKKKKKENKKLINFPGYLSESFMFCFWHSRHPVSKDLTLDSSLIPMFHWICLELPICKWVAVDSSLRLLLPSGFPCSSLTTSSNRLVPQHSSLHFSLQNISNRLWQLSFGNPH